MEVVIVFIIFGVAVFSMAGYMRKSLVKGDDCHCSDGAACHGKSSSKNCC